jgi:hypothetical protein
MASVEDVLLMRALEDAGNVPDASAAATVGGSLGAGIGALAGNDLVRVGDAFNRRIGRKPPLLTPGPRMAGGLVGLILGGGLGAGTREMMIQNSPGAAMLAKIRSGNFTSADKYQLERILEETYARMGLL